MELVQIVPIKSHIIQVAFIIKGGVGVYRDNTPEDGGGRIQTSNGWAIIRRQRAYQEVRGKCGLLPFPLE